MTFRVAIVGHSQVPTYFPELDDVEVRIFRRSGAKLFNFDQYEEFEDLFSWNPHLTITFLGGNDISNGPQSWTADDIATELIDLSWRLAEQDQRVTICLIEPRQYNNQHFNSYYRQQMHSINRRLDDTVAVLTHLSGH